MMCRKGIKAIMISIDEMHLFSQDFEADRKSTHTYRFPHTSIFYVLLKDLNHKKTA